MESENQDWKRFKPYFLWGLPILLALLVALFLLFTFLLPQGWVTYVPSIIEGNQMSLDFDSSGDAWLGTPNGLVQFDGEEWTIYSQANSGLRDNEIGSVAIDPSDNVWVGTAHGLDVFDGEGWTAYDQDFHTVVSTVIDSAGNLWIGDKYYGVRMFNGEDWTSYTQSNSGLVSTWLFDIAFDPSGNVWIGTDSGVSVFNSEGWDSYTLANSELVSNVIYAIAIDASGSIWCGTNHGMSVFDGENWTSYTEDNSGLISDNINSIAIDSSGNAWIGTGRGVSYFDGQNWISYLTNNSGLGNDYIRMIDIDPSGRVWFRSFGGISILDPHEAVSISPLLRTLREFLFSPASIWITCLSLVVLWFAIKGDNKPALVGVAGWAISLLFFGPRIIDNAGVGISVASNVIAIGALLGGMQKKENGDRGKRILKGVIKAIVILLFLGAILFFWVWMALQST